MIHVPYQLEEAYQTIIAAWLFTSHCSDLPGKEVASLLGRRMTLLTRACECYKSALTQVSGQCPVKLQIVSILRSNSTINYAINQDRHILTITADSIVWCDASVKRGELWI